MADVAMTIAIISVKIVILLSLSSPMLFTDYDADLIEGNLKQMPNAIAVLSYTSHCDPQKPNPFYFSASQ